MKTLIDRDELYKALAQWDWQDLYLPVHFKELVDEIPVVRHSYEDGVRKGYEDAVLHYAKMALKQWIPVSERLPEREDREEGTWMPHKLPHGGESIDHDICSKCGEQYSDAWSYNYCPNCGAKMGG